MNDRQRETRAWLGMNDDAVNPDYVPNERIVNGVMDADTTKPPPGIDRHVWAGMTEDDRVQVARFAAFLRAAPRLEPEG